MKNKKAVGSTLCIAFFCMLGLALGSIRGYSFSSYISFGLALLVLGYWLLRILACHHPKAANFLRRSLTVCLCLVLAAALVTGCFVVSGSFGSGDTSCDYIIVLGAGVNGTVPSLSLRERLDATLAYLENNPHTLCVVTGGQGPGEDITEASCMAQWLTDKGIDPARIILEEKSTSTQENLTFALDLLEARTGTRPETAGIVSSEYHLFRAGLIAEDLGLESVGIPAKTTWFTLRVNYYLREIAAVWYYLVFGG